MDGRTEDGEMGGFKCVHVCVHVCVTLPAYVWSYVRGWNDSC